MACCEEGLCDASMNHGGSPSDFSQTAADQCCATSEQRGQQHRSQSPERIVLIAAPIVLSAAPVSPATVERSRPVRVSAAARSAPLHVLFSVYLV
jgi:hypothetical protein